MIKKSIYILILVVTIAACKTKKNTTNNNANTMLLTKVLDNYNNSRFHKKTLKASLKAKYKGEKSLPSVNASLRIEKDKVIWLSISKLFFSVGKLKITPDRVQFYNNLDNSYFDGDFSLLSNFLGTDVNFKQVQSIFLGEAIYDLNKEDYQVEAQENNYLFTPIEKDERFNIFFWLDVNTYKTSKQEIRQEKENKLLSVQYNDFEKIENVTLPKHIHILAKNSETANTLDIDYKNVEFDLPLRFPFAIPSGYKEIKL